MRRYTLGITFPINHMEIDVTDYGSESASTIKELVDTLRKGGAIVTITTTTTEKRVVEL